MFTVAQQFAHTLKEIGVRYVFGVPSGSMIDFVAALRDEDQIDFVLVGHETTAAMMADVCGRLTGIPGVCFGTFGPGATNLATGVGGALLDRSPLLAFTDEMPDHLLHRTVQMNINHQQLFFPITKWTSRVNVENTEELILKGVGISLQEPPGSVHLGFPAGIGQIPAAEGLARVNYLRLERDKPGTYNPEAREMMAELFIQSKRPLLAVGLSAVRAGVQDEILHLAERFKIPVVLTPMAKGILSVSHPMYAGVLFHACADRVTEMYDGADLVVGIGYDPVEYNYEEWLPDVPLIHIDYLKADVDPQKIQMVLNMDGDIRTALQDILQVDASEKEWDLELLQDQKYQLRKQFEPPGDKFGPVEVLHGLRTALAEDGILTVDVGAHLHLVGQMWETPTPQNLIMTNGWSSMGFAIPAAMAAKMCRKDKDVVALMGDGGFMMMVGELATAKRLGLRIVFVVIRDNSLALIQMKQNKKGYDSSYGTSLGWDGKELTNQYFGVPVFHAHTREEYEAALKISFNSEHSSVIEVFVDPSAYEGLVLQKNK